MRLSETYYLQRALDLARKGLGKTWPNPMVGAVLVRNGRIVGEGWHRRAGGPHAEVYALRQAGQAARGATLYVNLEPCSHYGRTPPCSQAVIAAGISRVVAAIKDPNPKVAGRGLAALRKAGIRVEVGLLAEAARALNEVFLKRITTGLPFVICKAALSADGKIACYTGASQWISSPAARRCAHQLRALADAVVVGAGTVLRDNPHLNVRLARPLKKGGPVKIVLLGKRVLPSSLHLFQASEQRVILVSPERSLAFPRLPGLEIWSLPAADGQTVDIRGLLQRLAAAGMSLILVEGGSEVHAAFLGMRQPREPVWADRVYFFYAPKIIGGRTAPGPVGGQGVGHPSQAVDLKHLGWEKIGPDMLLKATPVKARQ